MLYKDTIRDAELLKLAEQRGVCVSIYLPSSPVTHDADGARIQLKTLGRDALRQAASQVDRRELQAMEDALADLDEDNVFWAYQAYGLAVLLTPDTIRTYRIAYKVKTAAEVSDRFYLKPLLPALRPQSACLLALAQNSVKLYEFTAAKELIEVDILDLPKDFSVAARRLAQRDSAGARRLEGNDAAKTLTRQFVREVEKAVRRTVGGSHAALVLAATTELQAMYRASNGYELLADEAVTGSPENVSDEDLRQSMLPIVAGLRAERIARWVDDYEQRRSAARTSTDLATIARLATQGQVSHLLVDADAVQYGALGDDGALELAGRRGPDAYDVYDEIAVRVLQGGGEVLAVRKEEDAPSALMPIAAILRWT